MTQLLALRDAARIAAVVSCLTSATFAQDTEAQERWTPALSMQFRGVSGTAISADGSRVAFVVREPWMEGKKSEYRSHVWVAHADGSGARQFTRGEKSASDPRFSPDGRWLAFKSERATDSASSSSSKDEKNGPRSQVWLLPMDGGEARVATEAESGVGSYLWSPDGKRIAYTMRDPQTKEEKKREREKRDVELVDQNFKFSHLYLADVDATGDEIEGAVRLTGGAFHVTGFDWSPDGKQIVFAHQPDPRINTARLAGDVSIVTLPSAEAIAAAREEHEADEEAKEEGEEEADEDEQTLAALGTVTPLVAGAGVERGPRWSPDGQWIAFVSTGTQPEPIGLGDLYVVPASGGEHRPLTLTPNRSASVIAWAEDSQSLYLSETLGTTRQVISVPLEGDGIHHVTLGNAVIGSVAMTPNGGHMAFTRQTPDTPADVYLSPTDRFAPKQLTDLHAQVARPPMGETRLLSWKAPDDTVVEGLLTLPIGYQEGQRYPLILNVHGGPAGVFSQSFTGGPSIYMLQYFAQEGFAILRPNPRGSTGYGKEFRFANFKDWGYGDLSDLLAGCDHVIELGIGDPQRQFLMGWSYGGYMTSFAVTQTDRFVAASMGAGLPNLISMTTTTDIGDYLTAHMGGEFWDDYATYERHSAIYHIAEVTTPTQVIHGANDLRVPFTQGQEFYRALQRRGVPTEMIVYPRTPHGPREPKFLMDVSDRILTWFRVHMPQGSAVMDADHARSGDR